MLGGERFGRNPFEGQRSERVYALLAKCPEVAALADEAEAIASFATD